MKLIFNSYIRWYSLILNIEEFMQSTKKIGERFYCLCMQIEVLDSYRTIMKHLNQKSQRTGSGYILTSNMKFEDINENRAVICMYGVRGSNITISTIHIMWWESWYRFRVARMHFNIYALLEACTEVKWPSDLIQLQSLQVRKRKEK